MSNYDQLKKVLNEIFELDKADLDFGIYRIMNQKRKQVNEFIDKHLPADIQAALSETQTSDKAELENELKSLKKNLENAGVVAEETPKYKTLQDKLSLLDNTDVLEQEVFSHLANFFRRYYKDGDFISMRRYKKDVYAIPYEGEEVKLHWANHDQYYIKSSENFKNYSFKLGDGSKVTFQLKEVTTEQNNNKTQGDAERRFAIYEELPVEVLNSELMINFVYEPFPKATKQDALLVAAISLLTESIPAEFVGVFAMSPTEKNGKRTLLEKHLNDYVSKNSFDYFIHKDLGGFLSRELDFYIKNEVLYIDDINARQTEFFVAQLSKVKAIKAVATKVITFLAQIENFQKKLWLKKKFVLRTDYCITLDRIPADYYPEIFANKAQLVEWKTLFDVELQNESQMAFEQFLVLDTKFFDEAFKDRLLAEFDDLDEQTNGLLINSENFQALELMQEKYQETVNTVYIDPPYNTRNDGFVYKDSLIDSSWLSFMYDRLQLCKNIAANSCCIYQSINRYELYNLKQLNDIIWGFENYIADVIWEQGRKSMASLIAINHEHILTYAKNIEDLKNENANSEYFRQKKQGLEAIYQKEKELRKIYGDDFQKMSNELSNYFKELDDSDKSKAHNHYCWIDEKGIYFPGDIAQGTGDGGRFEVIHPITNKPCKLPNGGWRFNEDNMKSALLNNKIHFGKDDQTVPCYKRYLKETEFEVMNSVFYKDNRGSSTRLKNLFGIDKLFPNPKDEFILKDLLKSIKYNKNSHVILDYFAGSGTTGHATIKLNREDNSNRKYILVEMGTYFNTVTKPRIQKVIYSDNWKNGKPQDKGGISQMFKYQVLESYEDTLNNLMLNDVQRQAQLDFSEPAQEEYMLHYMMEMETREHLFNLEMFNKPFSYQLKVTENNELRPTNVDLVETFNYLIGLYVSKVQRVKDIKVVEGVTRTGIKTLVIWRDMENTAHDDVLKLIRRFYDSARTREFQQIYINGDHHLENLRTEGDQFKVKMIEETFFKKMFNESEL